VCNSSSRVLVEVIRCFEILKNIIAAFIERRLNAGIIVLPY
jgi:hypothetical protein